MNNEQRAKCVKLLSEMLFTLTVERPVRADLEVIVNKCNLLIELLLDAGVSSIRET